MKSVAPNQEPAAAGNYRSSARAPLADLAHVSSTIEMPATLADQVRKIVDRDETVLTEIQRLVIIGPHQSVDALDAVVDVAE